MSDPSGPIRYGAHSPSVVVVREDRPATATYLRSTTPRPSRAGSVYAWIVASLVLATTTIALYDLYLLAAMAEV